MLFWLRGDEARQVFRLNCRKDDSFYSLTTKRADAMTYISVKASKKTMLPPSDTYYKKYCNILDRRPMSVNTRISYKQQVKKFLFWSCSYITASNMDALFHDQATRDNTICDYVCFLQGRQLSANSIKAAITAVCSFYDIIEPSQNRFRLPNLIASLEKEKSNG